MALTIIQNTVGYINAPVAAVDQGWVISGEYAIHSGCQSGIIKSLSSLGLIVARTYTINYEVSNYLSGGVKVICGTTNGTVRSANGVYSEDLVCATTPGLSFFSDGALRIRQLKIADKLTGTILGTTVSFNEDDNTWGAEYTMQPECLMRFGEDLLTLKDGRLWLHDQNEIRNNLHGVQSNSIIEFYANVTPEQVKIFYSMYAKASSPWYSPNDGDITILPVIGRSLGMSSRLKKGNYQNYQGNFYADFMRNMIDSRFGNNHQTALYKGEVLRGRVMKIRIINADTIEAILFEVGVKSSTSNIT